ncbi:unnamed protein product, partial [Laminaria digitata]
MDVDDDATVESAPSSGDESNDGSSLPVAQSGRYRKRKLPAGRGLGGATAAATTTATGGRKRGRRAADSGRGAGAGAGVGVGARGGAEGGEAERLDWPSTVVPRTPYGIPLLLSCLSSYPDKVRGWGQHEPFSGALELTSELLPQLSRYEMLREAKLQDRARCEQSESVCRMYAEASKSVVEPKASSPKLKSAFRAERQEAERESWRRQLEEMEEELARAMPPPSDSTAVPPPSADGTAPPPSDCSVPPPPDCNVPVLPALPSPVAVKGKGRPKGRRGATVSTRRYLKDTSAAAALAALASSGRGTANSSPPSSQTSSPSPSTSPR